MLYSSHNKTALDITRVNHQIQAKEVRVLGPEGENFGVLPLSDAIAKAQEFGLDLIEISPNATPPLQSDGIW